MNKSYFIVQYMPTGVIITISDTKDPVEAYEMAHCWDASIHFGPHEDSDVLDLDKRSSIGIIDEDGNDCWRECCEARCPAAGLFHTAPQP